MQSNIRVETIPIMNNIFSSMSRPSGSIRYGFPANLTDIINESLNSNTDQNFTSFQSNGFGNNTSRQVHISYNNGKKIEKIVEFKNGKRSERTIITDTNSHIK